jgi:hypothetical protein
VLKDLAEKMIVSGQIYVFLGFAGWGGAGKFAWRAYQAKNPWGLLDAPEKILIFIVK